MEMSSICSRSAFAHNEVVFMAAAAECMEMQKKIPLKQFLAACPWTAGCNLNCDFSWWLSLSYLVLNLGRASSAADVNGTDRDERSPVGLRGLFRFKISPLNSSITNEISKTGVEMDGKTIGFTSQRRLRERGSFPSKYIRYR